MSSKNTYFHHEIQIKSQRDNIVDDDVTKVKVTTNMSQLYFMVNFMISLSPN